VRIVNDMMEAGDTVLVQSIERALQAMRGPAAEARLDLELQKLTAALHAAPSYHLYIDQVVKDMIESFVNGDTLKVIACLLVQSGFLLALETCRAIETHEGVVTKTTVH
jgi:hypothetical protein